MWLSHYIQCNFTFYTALLYGPLTYEFRMIEIHCNGKLCILLRRKRKACWKLLDIVYIRVSCRCLNLKTFCYACKIWAFRWKVYSILWKTKTDFFFFFSDSAPCIDSLCLFFWSKLEQQSSLFQCLLILSHWEYEIKISQRCLNSFCESITMFMTIFPRSLVLHKIRMKVKKPFAHLNIEWLVTLLLLPPLNFSFLLGQFIEFRV